MSFATGTFRPPGELIVPLPTVADLARDAKTDYGALTITNAWIRRAVASERFASALNAELSNLRAQLRKQREDSKAEIIEN